MSFEKTYKELINLYNKDLYNEIIIEIDNLESKKIFSPKLKNFKSTLSNINILHKKSYGIKSDIKDNISNNYKISENNSIYPNTSRMHMEELSSGPKVYLNTKKINNIKKIHVQNNDDYNE